MNSSKPIPTTRPPELHIYSQGATFFSIASSERGIDWSTDHQLTGNPTIINDDLGTNTLFTVSGDGTKNVYIQFRDGYVGQAGIANLSSVETDSIVYDSTAPKVNIPYTTVYGNISNPTASLTSTASDSLSGIMSYKWSGEDLLFGSASSSNTTVSASSDGDYTVTLTVKDNAGNIGSDTVTFTRDTVAPTAADAGAANPSGSDLDSDRTPDFVPDTTLADVAKYQFQVGNYIKGKLIDTIDWDTWEYFSDGKNEPVMGYGYTHVRFRSLDAAGNPCASTYYDQYNYYIFPSLRVSPADEATIGVEDIAWPKNLKEYNCVPDHYKFYWGLSSRTLKELVLEDFRGNPIDRVRAFVDLTELSLDPDDTYYWKFEVIDASDEVQFVSPVYEFDTPRR